MNDDYNLEGDSRGPVAQFSWRERENVVQHQAGTTTGQYPNWRLAESVALQLLENGMYLWRS
jgi:hypothetical protein